MIARSRQSHRLLITFVVDAVLQIIGSKIVLVLLQSMAVVVTCGLMKRFGLRNLRKRVNPSRLDSVSCHHLSLLMLGVWIGIGILIVVQHRRLSHHVQAGCSHHRRCHSCHRKACAWTNIDLLLTAVQPCHLDPMDSILPYSSKITDLQRLGMLRLGMT